MEPVSLILAGVYAVLLGAAGAAFVHREYGGEWRGRRERRRLERALPRLAEWAGRGGFEPGDPCDPKTRAPVDEALALAGEVGERALGVVLWRPHRSGQILLVDSWGRTDRATTAMLATDGVVRRATWNEGDTRLTLAPGRIVAHAPGPLTPERAEALVQRLTQLDDAIPRLPGAGRL